MMKFRIETDEEIGRYPVASEKLNPGDVIFTEKPFAYGPKSETFLICLGCYNPVDGSNLCSKCNWPVCSPECENIPAHRNAECKVFSAGHVKFNPFDPSATCLQYECITPLRVLLSKEINVELWEEEISLMEHHSDLRKETQIWEFNQINVVDYLRGPCKLDRFPEDLIHQVCGILDVNAFEARTNTGCPIRCLYPKLAILSHNCVSNITHSIDGEDDFALNVRAAIGIAQGEQLYSSYTFSLWPTIVRREFLKESKYFDCKCKRCADPTELGTNLSTLKCNKCDNGIIRSTDPLDSGAIWKCTHCEFQTPGQAVRKVFAAIQADLESVEEAGLSSQAIEFREALYRKYRSVLHPKNAYMSLLRSALGTLYGKAEGYGMEDLPDLLLERKAEMCRDLLEVLDVVEPGYTRIRGLTLYELHAPLILLAKNAHASQCIKEEELRKKLEEALDILEQAANILTLEPSSTSEGSIGLAAKQTFDQLKENFDAFIESF